MNVGFVTTQLFDAPRSGGELCTARLVRAFLRAGHRVHLIGRGDLPGSMPVGANVQTLGPRVAPFDTLPRSQQVAHLLSAWARGRASTVERLAGEGAARVVQAWLSERQAQGLDLLVVDHLQAYGWLARWLPRGPAPMVVMHNLESAGYRERAAAADASGQPLQAAVFRREARLLQALERRVLRDAAAVACLSDADAEVWRRMAASSGSAAHVEVLPGFPIDADTPVLHPAAKPGERRIGMLGTWTWGPNRQALDWMMGQVLPRLPGHCVLRLAGTGLETLALPPRVQLLGRLDDVGAFYAGVDVVAIPSHAGSGVQEKAIEALARAPALVATRHALRGLEAEALPHVCLADGASAFAQACASFEPAACGRREDAVAAWASRRQARYGQALARCIQAAMTPRPASHGPWASEVRAP